jgi:hypothetical protein
MTCVITKKKPCESTKIPPNENLIFLLSSLRSIMHFVTVQFRGQQLKQYYKKHENCFLYM